MAGRVARGTLQMDIWVILDSCIFDISPMLFPLFAFRNDLRSHLVTENIDDTQM